MQRSWTNGWTTMKTTNLAPTYSPSQFKHNKRNVKHAIKYSNNSSPGPDVIPFVAWRRCINLSTEILFDAVQPLLREDGPEALAREWGRFNHSSLFFLPKNASGKTSSGEGYYESENVRPLNVTNTDNRLLASAIKHCIEPIIGPKIIWTQRGFVSGRSLLANLVDIDEAMALSACSSEEGGAIFFDFAAVFPSVEHEFLFALFRKLGWPVWLLSFIRCLYYGNTCHIALGGGRHEGFDITRGIRQGCPLSPLLFAVASDVLLRRLDRFIPGACTRAYADDLALVHHRILSHAGTLQDIFFEYESITGLRLNIDKTVFVPLFLHDVCDLRTSLVDAAPLWGALPIAGKAKYLGFVLGPDRGIDTWTAAATKYEDRARTWGKMSLGMLSTMDAYQVFIAPVFMFLAQLDPVPNIFDKLEEKVGRILFPGPRGWIDTCTLKRATDLHFPKNLCDIRCSAVACRARVAMFENHMHGGLQVVTRARALRQVIGDHDNMFRVNRFRGWLTSNFLLSLDGSMDELRHVERSLGIGSSLLHDTSEEARQGWQARASRLVRQRCQLSPMMHVRRKLDRWQVRTLPGHRANHWVKVLCSTTKLLPPRVKACQLRTAMNGWFTGRRFQQTGGCLFACRDSEDSIEHYAHCKAFHQLCKQWLGLDKPPPDERLADFLGIQPWVNSLPEHCRDDNGFATVAALRAIGVFSLYKTHNAVRHGNVGRGDAQPAFKGFIRDATRDHVEAMKIVSVAFKRPRSSG